MEAFNKFAAKELPVGSDELGDMSAPSEEDWDGLIRLMGLTAADRQRINDLIEFRQKPLFVLPRQAGALVDVANAMDVLWDRFEGSGASRGESLSSAE
ncbi:MAG TPA: hypothetical protein VJZ91_03225 [Blastocatellia bacterium]|nr:hypothetical protein [Blastocatellia bacterium]